MEAFIFRFHTGDQGTAGVLYVPAVNFSRPVIELPWRDNRRNVSCVPPGDYDCMRIVSSRYGECFWIRGVEGRTGILTHWGNVAGDQKMGFRTHSAGCILIGSYAGKLWGQRAVLASRRAFRELMEEIETDYLKLSIKEVY